jgi:hypothetical protein
LRARHDGREGRDDPGRPPVHGAARSPPHEHDRSARPAAPR